MHATLRVLRDVGNLRRKPCFSVLKTALGAGCERPDFRLVHFSVQHNHLHMLVEGKDTKALALGLRGLEIRLARALNRFLGRTGRVFADRYHARALRTPREVKVALGYVLCNARRHAAPVRYSPSWIDPCSSGGFFDGWRSARVPARAEDSPVATPRTWLLAAGWRRHGLLSVDDVPGPGPKP